MSAERIVLVSETVGNPDWELIASMIGSGHEHCTRSACCLSMVADSIREQNKPTEPTNLGAVVEEADGSRWVFVDGSGENRWANRDSLAQYRNLDVVRVLSEGVSA